jgi:hypothetical protein
MFKRFFLTGYFDGIFFTILFLLGVYLAFGLRQKEHKGGREITYDKAGYYVYLPATFIYGWDSRKFPKGIVKETNGFTYDTVNHKIFTKCTCGVAMLFTPFWLGIHSIAIHENIQPDGFSDFYERMILVPGVFYLILGLYFLFRFLRYYFSKKLSFITVLLLFAGTNLFYYGIDEGLMSHVNSFFLFCLFLFLLKKFLGSEKKPFSLIVGISFVLSMAILIRPTNILLFSWLIFLDITSLKALQTRILLFLKPAYIITFFIIAGIVFLPQLFYWKYLTGNFIFYSYPGETFRNWNNPQMLSVWFAPLNGFFLYTPLAIFFMIGIIQMIRNKQPNGIFIGLIFLFISYLFSSWQCWYFGGSFGYRPFVEYYALLSVPFAYFLGSIKRLKNLYLRSIIVILIFASGYYNQRLTWRQSWNSSSTWSWDYYLQYLDIAGLYHFPGTTYTFKEDFENRPFYNRETQFKCVHSPTMAAIVKKDVKFYSIFRRNLATILKNPVKRISASIWVQPGKLKKTKLLVYFVFEDWRHTVYYFRRLYVDDFIKNPDCWTKVYGTIEIPEWMDQGCFCDVGIWNTGENDAIYFDDLNLRFE